MTATDVLAERERRLREDPEFRAKSEALAAEHQARVELLREAQEPLLAALREAGVNVDSAWRIQSLDPYPKHAIPILLDHLARPYPDPVRHGIARALVTKFSGPYWPDLVAIYRGNDPVADRAAQDGLAEVLMTVADRSVADQVLELLWDDRVGSTRILFLRTLTRLRLPEAWDVIQRAAQDPVLGKEAQHMLHKRALRQRK